MRESAFLLFPILFPILAGVFLLVSGISGRRVLAAYVGVVLAINTACTLAVLLGGPRGLTLFYLTSQLEVRFQLDLVGKLFAGVVSVTWLAAGVYSFRYMEHDREPRRYFGFYLIACGVLLALDFAGNLITFYLFYEMMTLCSLPLVLHSRTHEAIIAGLKYLFYSLCGAYMALFGLYFVYHYSTTLDFTPGGVLDPVLAGEHSGLLLTAAFLMLMGFGVKAGLFPLHGWLPAAHPVAPAPASGVLSGVIVKAGVLGSVRAIYFIFGADFLRGSWVQTTMLILCLITILLGSMMAYLERGLKKRLAYSSVSQVSYILFGLFLLQPDALTGGLLHMVFHSQLKCGLFLCAGAVIYRTGETRADHLGGIGKAMPVTMWCFTLCSLGLVGIPPFSGFVSKWYLCLGAMEGNLAVFSWLGPVVLLVSALLTAGYLLPVSIRAFLPGAEISPAAQDCREAPAGMAAAMVFFGAAALASGLASGGLAQIAGQIAAAVL